MTALLKPGAMRPGQTIGLVAPSSAMPAPEKLDQATLALESMGYRVKVDEGCMARHGYLAGDDQTRADAIHRMFADDAVDIVMCARGGFGATRIVSRLRYDLIRANPKIFTGYSDVTALHGAIQRHAGLVTFHGLMAVPDFPDDVRDAFSVERFLCVVGNPEPAGLLENPPGFPRRALRPGRAEGRLVGGNLTLVASTLGTPYAFDFDGAILFLEDVGERSYRIDRMLTQLDSAGVFSQVRGVLLGTFSRCDPAEGSRDFTIDHICRDRFQGLPIPVLAGVQCGHTTPKLTLPLGARCRMDADRGTVEILEGAVL